MNYCQGVRINMKKSNGKRALVALVALTVILGLNFSTSRKDAAAAGTEAVQFNVNTSVAENLAAFKGKSVTIYLISGHTLTGIINDVKGNLLNLGKLSLVPIDRISAVELRVR
jgi:hypothetical protein